MNWLLILLHLSFSFSIYAIDQSMVMKDQLPPSTPGKCLNQGAKAPNFSLNLVNGQTWELANQIKKGPIVLVFYRGGWCPYCNLQLRAYEKEYEKIKNLGASILAISVDKVDKDSINSKKKFSFDVASDPDYQSIKLFNLVNQVPQELVAKLKSKHQIDLEKHSGKKHHVIAIPAIAIIDSDQKVKWCYANENYKIRPAIKVIEAKLK